MLWLAPTLASLGNSGAARCGFLIVRGEGAAGATGGGGGGGARGAEGGGAGGWWWQRAMVAAVQALGGGAGDDGAGGGSAGPDSSTALAAQRRTNSQKMGKNLRSGFWANAMTTEVMTASSSDRPQAAGRQLRIA